MDFRDRYRYDPKADLIGKGGFAKVFRAYDDMLERQVALKVYASEASGKYDLLHEIKRAIRLEHPNLCRYYDVALLRSVTAMGEEENLQVGVMEYLGGGDIKQYVKAHPEHLRKLLGDVLRGLSYLHAQGIVHRDLTPSNILIKETPSGPVAKVTDFGISKAIDSVHTNSSELLGKVEYMAPEQFNPARYGIDGRISTNLDLWSFGCLVYELFMDEPLFGSRKKVATEQVIMNILQDLDLSATDNLPKPYRTVVNRCLVRDPKQRVQRAEILLSVLEGNDTEGGVQQLMPIKKKPKRRMKPSEETQILGKAKPSAAKPAPREPRIRSESSPTEERPQLNPALRPAQRAEEKTVKAGGNRSAVYYTLGLAALLVFCWVAFFSGDGGADAANLTETTTGSTDYSTTDTTAYSEPIARTGSLYGLTDTYGATFDYEGEILGDLPHGRGRAKYTSGNSYEGNYVNGRMDGQGTYWLDGDKYVGQFKDDKFNGQGTYWLDGDKYVGQFKDDKFNGQGTYTYANNDKYVGQFKDGKSNGQGTYTWAEGIKYVGQWKNDKRHGHGRMYDEDGNLTYSGAFENDKQVD